MIAALLLGAWQPVLAQETPDEPAQQGIRYDAPPYAMDGPYDVGVRYFTIPAAAENDRELTATVWYPAEPPEGDISEIVYELQFPTGQFPPFSVLGDAQLDAPPDASGAPYPLVVYSHAHWSMGQEVPYFVEHLASRGFVVISVDHEDNWSTDMGPMAFETMIRRPQEVTRQIDFAEQLSAPDGDLAGLIATDKVGVAGWSMGGVTALAVAGARMDLAGLRAWCEANPDLVEAEAWACVDILNHEAEMAEFAGLDEVPTGLWPSTQDDRVAAAVRLSGSLTPLGSKGLAAVDVPVLLFHGGGEAAASPSTQMGEPYASVASPRKAEVVLDHASHMVFFSSCDEAPDMVAIGFPMFCTDPVWDMDRAHDLINHFATAFLLAELKGDAEAAAALAPENVSFPGIQYESTEFGSAVAESSPSLDDTTTAKIDAIVEKAMTDFPTPGFELCIVKDGDVVYSKGFGLADVAENRAATPQTLNLQASISKSMTAAAIMRLAEQGLIDLDAPVTDYLPYFTMADDRYPAITVRMLLSHRSGMPDSPANWTEPLDPALNPLEQAVRDLAEMELLFAPGEGWSYSSYGYSVLGAIIAAVTGESYESYMVEQWLAPLGMTQSTFVTEDVDPDAQMTGYVSDEAGKATPTGVACDGRDASACTLWSNCEDMAKYAQFLLNEGEVGGNVLLQSAAVEAMWTPVSETGWAEMNGPHYGLPLQAYGLGWVLGEADGHRLVGHPGGIDGYNSQILLAPDDGLAVIAMDNWLDLAAIPAFPASFAATDVMYALLGIEPEAETPAVQLAPDLTAQIDAMIEETMARIALPGFALAVVKDGEVAYAQGYGVTSLDGGAPVTDQTIFQWAESTMALTAMAVMQLVEEGKLDLDAPVTDYVPYFKLADERYKAITVGQLLAHSSGIPDSGDAMADWENFLPEYDGGALERWVRNDLAEKGLLFAPGEGWEYSDLGYALLGAVIGAASGQPYEAYMAEHILAPLGMDQSTFLLEEVDKALLASPHVPDATGEVAVSKAMPYHRPFAATNNLFASVADMAKLALANLNQGELGGQQILLEGAYDVMWTATSPTPFADFPFGRVHPANMMSDWGDGWFLGDIAGHLTAGSYGGEHGFNAFMLLIPDANIGIVAVGNGQATDEFYAPDIATDVAAMLVDGK